MPSKEHDTDIYVGLWLIGLLFVVRAIAPFFAETDVPLMGFIALGAFNLLIAYGIAIARWNWSRVVIIALAALAIVREFIGLFLAGGNATRIEQSPIAVVSVSLVVITINSLIIYYLMLDRIKGVFNTPDNAMLLANE